MRALVRILSATTALVMMISVSIIAQSSDGTRARDLFIKKRADAMQIADDARGDPLPRMDHLAAQLVQSHIHRPVVQQVSLDLFQCLI